MRWRGVIALYLLAALLGVEYWVIERPRQQAGAPSEAPRARMFSIQPEDVVRVELAGGRERIVVALENGAWTIVHPEGQAIPRDLIRAFVEAIVGTEVIDWLPTDAESMERFGFGPQAAQVSLWDRSGTRWNVEIGAVSPTGTAVYVRQPGGDVALVGRNAQYYLDLIIGAARTRPMVEPDVGRPVASPRLTIDRRAG